MQICTRLKGCRSGRGTAYPFAVKVAAGKVNAVTGGDWSEGLNNDPQDYLPIPEQPWLDGYCVGKGVIRQFVAMPLGAGYTAEEQLTGRAEHGGLQILVRPMKREAFDRHFPERAAREYNMPYMAMSSEEPCCSMAMDMGLAPGGRLRQEIYDDPFALSDWDAGTSSRCFVHIANSLVWRAVTGSQPPTTPPTAREYARSGLPWFDYMDADAQALDSTEALKRLKSVIQLGKEKGGVPLPENESIVPEKIVVYRKGLQKGQVREGAF